MNDIKYVDILATHIPVAKEVDVLVAGGGPAGFAAAIAAARNNASTLLIEQYGCLGGMSTIGLVGPYMRTAGTNGGIFKEMLERLTEMGAAKGYGFDAEILKYLKLLMCEEAGVNMLLHTFAESAYVENKVLKGVFIANKEGRQVILAKRVIDCTGDADIAASAGAPFEKGRLEDGLMQAVSLFFRVGGIEPERLPENRSEVRKKTEKAREAGEINLPEYVRSVPLGGKGSTIRDTEVSVNVDTMIGIDGTKAEDLTLASNESRKRVMECINFYRKYVPGMENCFLMDTAPLIGIRETRRIMGEAMITKEDVLSAKKADDGIAKASFFLDLHDGGLPSLGEVLSREERNVPKGDWYEIPYGCLVPKKIDKLLTAGRCISSDREANGSLRIMPTCMATGQAAGTAAALSLGQDVTPRELNVRQLQKTLLEQGADLREEIVT